MALELQISQGNAQKALEQIERSISSLQAQLNRFSSNTSGFEVFLQRLQGFQGLGPNAVTSIREFAKATQSISNNQAIANLSRSLSKLAALDVTKAAKSVQSLSAALASIRVPVGLFQVTQQFNSLTTSARQASQSVTAFNNALRGVRAPSGLTTTVRNLGQINAATRQAAGGVNLFSSAMGNAKSFIAGFGLSLGALGLSKFVQDIFEVRANYEKLIAMISNIHGVTAAGATFEFLRKTAKETATDLNTLTGQYGQFAVSAHSGGLSASDTAESFRKLTVVFRSLGLSTEQTKGAMYAFNQMLEKQQVQAEELKRQLSNQGVPAVMSMARALGVTQQELAGMMKAGELTGDAVRKLIDQLERDFSGTLEAKMRGVVAQMTLLQNSATELMLLMGPALFTPIIAGVQQLTAALENPAVQIFAVHVAALAGALGGALLWSISAVVETMALLYQPIALVVNGMVSLIALISDSTVGQWAGYFISATGAATGLSNVLKWIIGTAGAVWVVSKTYGLLVDGFQLAARAAILLRTAMIPQIAVFAGLAATVIGVAGVLQYFSGNALGAATVTDSVRMVFERTKESAQDLAKDLTNLVDPTKATADELSRVRDSSLSASPALMDLGRSVDYSSDAFNRQADAALSSADAIRRAAAESEAAQRRMSSASGLSYDYNSGTGGSNARTGFMTSDEFNAQPFGFGTGSLISRMMGESAFGFKSGGIVGLGSSDVYSVSMSKFNAAPSLARGGTTNGYARMAGGGIPIIAHPNEAVVPLSGGRSIPVQMQGASSGNIAPSYFNTLIDYTIELIQNTAIVAETIRSVGVIVKNEFDRLQFTLDQTNALLGGIADTISAIDARASSSSVSATPANAYPDYAQPAPTLPSSGFWGAANSMAGGIVNADTPMVAGWGANPVDVARQMNEPTASPRAGFFAKGTPNAYDEVRKGSAVHAVIHPDEAVVPLPDGRAIPVRLQNDFSRDDIELTPSWRRQERASDDASENPTSHGTNITVPVQMTVYANDADSFRRSQDQIMQDLRMKMDRAVRGLGVPSDVDDPTRR